MVSFEGAAELTSDLRKMVDELQHDTMSAIAAEARQLIPTIQSIMPKVTGRLAGSVHVETPEATEVDVLASTIYANWIEYGGSRGRPFIAAGRFLTPTVKGAEGAIQDRVLQQVQSTIGSFPWSHTSSAG